MCSKLICKNPSQNKTINHPTTSKLSTSCLFNHIVWIESTLTVINCILQYRVTCSFHTFPLCCTISNWRDLHDGFIPFGEGTVRAGKDVYILYWSMKRFWVIYIMGYQVPLTRLHIAYTFVRWMGYCLIACRTASYQMYDACVFWFRERKMMCKQLPAINAKLLLLWMLWYCLIIEFIQYFEGLKKIIILSV